MPQRIIVSGIYRSGTSLTAELIRRWGAFAGHEDDLYQDRNCYMEHLAIQTFNEELLNKNSRVPVPAEELLEKAADPIYKERALQILNDMDRDAERNHAIAWIWKDPQLPLAIPFWAHIWGDVIHIIPVRHPIETIVSAATLEGFAPEDIPLSAGLAYWQYCMLNLLWFTQTSSRKLFLAYDQLIEDPQQVCSRICRFLDEQCGVPSAASDERIKEMVSQVVPGEYHHHAPRSLAEVETATQEQRALYNFLRIRTMYPNEPFRRDDFALYPGWREYLQAIDTMMNLGQAGASGDAA
ncbi:MAG: sulfotransferase [Chloroflexota bacterium]